MAGTEKAATSAKNARAAIDSLLAQNRYTAVTLAAFDLQEITLLWVKGVEQLSEPFQYEVTIVSRRRIRNFTKIVGQPLSIGLKLTEGATRYLNGVVKHFSYLGLDDSRRPMYVAEIVPWLAMLDFRRNSRIFQNLSGLEIVKKILGEHPKCLFRDNTQTPPPKRPYCVQYNETDMDFVSRLLESEGIYYYFTHKANQHEMILADGPAGHKPCQPRTVETNLSLSNHRMHDDLFWDWRESVSFQPGQVTLKDYNFEMPTAQLTSLAPVPSVQTGGMPTMQEARAFERLSKGASGVKTDSTATGRDGAQRELFHYPGKYADKATGDFYARIRSEEIAAQAYRVRIIGNVRRLCTGETFVASNPFEISDTTIAPVPSDTWLAVRSEIEIVGEAQDESARNWISSRLWRADGRSGSAIPPIPSKDGDEKHLFRCVVTALPANTQYRPPRRTPAPVIAGPQTAIVVGRPGEVVTTDRYGRIKVQFMWDREGRKDENSSCWIRVAQPLAGKSFGAIATPRVGQEIVVEFLNGDPDSPLVTGTLYNATNMPAENLPAESAVTTLRTRTIGGSANEYNELRLDDNRGSEEVYVRAQKTMAVDIGETYEITAKDEFALKLTGAAPWQQRAAAPMSGSEITVTPEKISFIVSTKTGKNAIEITDKGIFMTASTIGFLARGKLTGTPPILPVPSAEIMKWMAALNVPPMLADPKRATKKPRR